MSRLLMGVVVSAFLSTTSTASELDFIPLTEDLTSHGFERIAEENGVAVFKHPDSDLIRVAAEGRFSWPPLAVRQVLLDYRRQQGNVGQVSQSRILESGPGWLLVYQRLNLPIISDRDFTLQVTWGAEQDLLWIRYTAKSHLGPPDRSGVVRVTVHDGSWQLFPIHGGRGTYVRFQASIDLAGWLPMWLAKSGAGDELSDLFQSFRKLLARL